MDVFIDPLLREKTEIGCYYGIYSLFIRSGLMGRAEWQIALAVGWLTFINFIILMTLQVILRTGQFITFLKLWILPKYHKRNGEYPDP